MWMQVSPKYSRFYLCRHFARNKVFSLYSLYLQELCIWGRCVRYTEAKNNNNNKCCVTPSPKLRITSQIAPIPLTLKMLTIFIPWYLLCFLLSRVRGYLEACYLYSSVLLIYYYFDSIIFKEYSRYNLNPLYWPLSWHRWWSILVITPGVLPFKVNDCANCTQVKLALHLDWVFYTSIYFITQVFHHLLRVRHWIIRSLSVTFLCSVLPAFSMYITKHIK